MDSETIRLLQATEAARERGDWHTVYQLLRDAHAGETLASTMLAEAGFVDVEINEVDTEPFNLYYVARKP